MTYSIKATKIHRDYSGDSRYKEDFVMDEDTEDGDIPY
jgi:hypothetical protein